jgi:hypothetical protein
MMRMIRRGHCILPQPGATGEIRLMNQLFSSSISPREECFRMASLCPFQVTATEPSFLTLVPDLRRSRKS